MPDVACHDPYTQSIPQCFERIVAAYPDNLAVGGIDWQPTFGELNTAANRVAHAILRSGIAPGDRVAILMEHDAPLIAAIVGVLKAGCVVVVFNTTDPPARHRQLVESAEPAILLVEAGYRAIGLEIARSATVLCFDDVASDGPRHNPGLEISADQNAFIVYTSGSTGQPNGVLRIHDALIANAQVTATMLEVSSTDRVLLLASVSSGQGTTTLFTGLLSGASVWPFLALKKGVHGLAQYISENAITVCLWSASIFRHMAMTIRPDHRFPTVHSMRLMSERATQQDFRIFQRHFADRCTLNYTLSSSETGAIAYLALRPGDDVGEGALPIGRLIDGVRIELLDEAGCPVPHGKPGQLVVTSPSVTVGYWRNPELTAERCSIATDARFRTFRTSDLARWTEGGLLEFVGRLQQRVKIRGYTVALPEVEQALQTVPGLKAAACSVFELPPRAPRLVAFVVRDRTSQPSGALQPAALRRLLRALLPRQMIPSTFVFVDDLPLAASGKIDHGRLRELYETRERDHSDRPATDTEALLARIWCDILGFDDIGRQDDFFDLGGDSLTASVVAASLQTEACIELDLGVFAANPTLEMLAGLVDSMRSNTPAPEAAPGASATKPKEPAPLSFGQQFYWDTSRTIEETAQHTVTGYFRLVGALNVDVLHDSLQLVCQRHEMLRTSFREIDGRAVQIVELPAIAPLPLVDVSTDPGPIRSAHALLGRNCSHSFDLAKAPLALFALIRLSEREHWLTVTNHHIISDGWSWRIFLRELAESYDAKIHGTDDVRPAARQFGDFARWQRQEFQPGSSRYRKASIELIDQHLRGAYPRNNSYRRLLLWVMRRLRSGRSKTTILIGFVLRALFAPSPPPAKLLPFRKSRCVSQAVPTEGLIGWRLRSEVIQRLDELCRDEAATHFAARLAACAVVISDAIGSHVVAIATHFTNRNQPETQNVFGFCANLMTLALDCDSRLTFREFVRAVDRKTRALQPQSAFPYDELQRTMHAWKVKPLRNTVHVSVATAAAPIRTRDLLWAEGETYAQSANIEFKFASANDDRNDVLRFNTELYDPAVMRDFADRLVRLFEVVAENPDLKLSELLAMSRRAAG